MNSNHSIHADHSTTALTRSIPQKLTSEIEHFIYQAMKKHQFVEFSLYDDYEDLKIIGIIDQFDSTSQRVKIDGEWFSLQNVMKVYVNKGKV